MDQRSAHLSFANSSSHVMSTFDGIVPEFPEIRIDHFRKSPSRSPPLACFLSHVHSDHLQGLESFRAPFIYTSQATRLLLLGLEKFPHRMNFHKGILESRRLHYKHLAKLLRPIPLNTPTEIELTPLRRIRVTLFDANHCPGAVMFLIEGDGKAILYTGDIRAEKWWIDSIVRQPVLIPYTFGHKRLDKLYLDTTFARASNPLREFSSKAEGLAELLRKVDSYPQDTVFYFRAWTFGYEDVWVALSTALSTRIHMDSYQMGLYRSLARQGVDEALSLCGFDLGNRTVAGCLSESESCRIHSCEPGVSCPSVRKARAVYITPIVNRTKEGFEIPEVGAGGGMGDLYQTHELEVPDEDTLTELTSLCLKHKHIDKEHLNQVRSVLLEASRSGKKALSLDKYGVKEEGDISLSKLVTMLGRGLAEESEPLPNSIRFPYSRHSSYSELCNLVAAFRPRDIHPCTVDPSTWSEDTSMQRLFGHLCSGNEFSHDVYMYETLEDTDYEGNQRGRKKARYEENTPDQSTQASSQNGGQGAPPADDDDDGLPLERIEKTRQTQPNAKSPPKSTMGQSLDPSSLRPPSPPKEEDPHRSDSPGFAHQELSKREEVRRAHQYLQENVDPGLIRIGPLHPPELDSKQNPNSREIEQRTPSPQSHPTNAQDSQRTDITSLSMPESALAISPPPQKECISRDALDPEDVAEDNQQSTQARIKARRRARITAFLAAREDTWVDVSLTSAGNNHAEEEMEL